LQLNSIERAEKVVKTHFPTTGHGAVTAASIADLLGILCLSEYVSDISLSDTVDNFFALRTAMDSEAEDSSSESGDSDEEVCSTTHLLGYRYLPIASRKLAAPSHMKWLKSSSAFCFHRR
jgi:hypothetical protein